RGRSFRSAPPETAGAAGPQWLLTGRLQAPTSADAAVGVGWSRDGPQLRLRQADTPPLQLGRRVPVQVLEPDSPRTLEDGPAYRRRYVDWGVFHVEHQFYPA